MVNLDYLYNYPFRDIVSRALKKDYFIDKKLGFQVIKHGTILPHRDTWVNGVWTWGKGGIVDSDGKFIDSSSIIMGVNGAYTPPQNQFNTALKLSYISLFFSMYGVIS